MSKKESVYFPKYRASRTCDASQNEVFFSYNNSKGGRGYFITEISPKMTRTQKAALKWTRGKSMPPVVCIKHKKPEPITMPEGFRGSDNNLWYYPYAVVTARFVLLGEPEIKRIEIYFCKTEVHKDNTEEKVHVKGKGIYITPR